VSGLEISEPPGEILSHVSTTLMKGQEKLWTAWITCDTAVAAAEVVRTLNKMGLPGPMRRYGVRKTLVELDWDDYDDGHDRIQDED